MKSPNPAFADIDVPLASTFILSKKKGKEAWVEPVIEEGGNYRFEVRAGLPPEAAQKGTKLARGPNFRCLMSETPLKGDYIKAEGMAGRMGARLMAIVAEGDRGRVYLSPTAEHETIPLTANPSWQPETAIAPDKRSMFTPLYGLTTFGDLFTDRQLVTLTTFSDLVSEAREQVRRDASRRRSVGRRRPPPSTAASAPIFYAEAVSVYLANGRFEDDQYAHSSITSWHERQRGIVAETFSLAKRSLWFGTTPKANLLF